MTDLGPTNIGLLFVEAWLFCCQSAAILGHLPYHIGNFHPLFTKHLVGSVGDVGLLLRFPCFSELVCRCADARVCISAGVKMRRCENAQILMCTDMTREDALVSICEDVKMHVFGCADVKMRVPGGACLRICRCEDARVWICAGVKI